MNVRLRHPESAKIQSVLVNGVSYDGISADGETIILEKPEGHMSMEVRYC